MENVTRDIRRNREEQYFLEQEQKRLEEVRRRSEQEMETHRLMQAFGIREPQIVRELAMVGFDAETARVLDLAPMIQIAWSDGGVSRQEREEILKMADLRGVRPGSAAYLCLAKWLTERPSDGFFQACLHGVKAVLRHRSPAEAESLRREIIRNSTVIAAATGGFFSLGSRVSRDEEQMLQCLAQALGG